MSSNVTVTSVPPCCDRSRPVVTDSHTGQTLCRCRYGAALLNYARAHGLPDGIYGTSVAAYAAGAAQGYLPLWSDESAFYRPWASPTTFDMKESSEAWRALAVQSGFFPYAPSMALYSYGLRYGGVDLNARRKNATRETTNTLKAWLFEHRKNPYPTKGDKIMLAITTKMTLTQVSTWFANARRRLKKENNMTWSPRNRSEDDVSGDEYFDIDAKTDRSDTDEIQVAASLEESCKTRRTNPDRETFDRIISVDDDDEEVGDHSDFSNIGDTDVNESVNDRRNYNSIGGSDTASLWLHDTGSGAKATRLESEEDFTTESETKSPDTKNVKDLNGNPKMTRPKI